MAVTILVRKNDFFFVTNQVQVYKFCETFFWTLFLSVFSKFTLGNDQGKWIYLILSLTTLYAKLKGLSFLLNLVASVRYLCL